MRHRIAGRRLGRDSEHRVAMRRNMVMSLFEHERISTTIQKAKEIKSFAEKLITLAKKGDLAARRRAISLLGGDRAIVDYEDGAAVRKGTVISKLFSEIGPRYLDRPGGYTRIIKLGMKRLGDNGQVVLLQLIDADEESTEVTGSSSNKRAKRANAYAEKFGDDAKAAVAVAEPTEAEKAQEPDAAEQAPAEETTENPKAEEAQGKEKEENKQ